MLRVEGLTKHYGSHRGVIDISFSLEKGKSLGLLGPNGAGKSTVIRMLAGTLKPTAGRVVLTGSVVDPSRHSFQQQLGYLPETAPLYSTMTVRGYLRFAAGVKGVHAKKQQLNLERVLAECHLEDSADRVIGRLSKGYRQRVGLAQALINDPSLLILDEPTAGLDPRQSNVFRTLIQNMQGHRTVLLSTHILSEVQSVCSDVIIMNHGKIAAQSTLDSSWEQSSSERRFYLEISGPEKDVLMALQGLHGVNSATLSHRTGDNRFVYNMTANHSTDPRDQLVRLIAAQGWQLFVLRPDHRDLETLFLEAISGTVNDENVQCPV